MVCNDRQLTEAQRAAAFEQNRNAGALKAIRPFTGQATPDNLVDYLNREVYPVLKQARTAVNEIYRQVTDNAPSGNPLGFVFSTIIVDADPGPGFMRLNTATQEDATIIRVNEQNQQLKTVAPWLDVMAGSSTAPLGVVTLFTASDPSRFIRWNLDTMTDQGTYWDLGVTYVESSHDNPFVDDDQVVLSFIPGVASTGTTIPPSSITPIAANTIVGNPTASTAAPQAISVGTNTVLGRVAGNIVAAQLVNDQITDATIANAKLANMAEATIKGRARGAGTGVPTDLTGSELGSVLRIGGQTDAVEAPGTFNDYAVAEGTKLLRVVPSADGDVVFTGISYGGGSNTDGWIRLFKFGASGRVVLKHEQGSSANNRFQLPDAVDFILDGANESIDLQYVGGRWQPVGRNARFERLGAPVYDVVLDFGAAGDGATDDTAALNAAIAAANAAPGIIYLGAAHLVTAGLDTITGNAVLIRGRGISTGGSRIDVNAASAPTAVFTFTGQASGIEDVWIRALATYATGCALLVSETYRVRITRCLIEAFANGIEISSSTLTTVIDCTLAELREDFGIWVHGSALGQSHATWVEHCVSSVTVSTTLTAYLHDGHAHTFRLLDCAAIGGGYGLRVVDTLASGSDGPHFTRAVNLELDHNQFGGVVLEAGEQAEFEQLFITSVQDGCGFEILSTFNGDWRIDGAFIFSATEEGIRIAASDGLLSGVMVGAVSIGSSNVYDGIAVASGVERFSIVGCSACRTFLDTSPGARYGLSIASGCDDYVVVGNRFTDNVSGGILNTPGVSSTRVVRSNIPETTEGAVPHGDYGDITVSSGGTVWNIDADVVTNTELANMAEATIKGRAVGAGSGDPTDLTGIQAGSVVRLGQDQTVNVAVGTNDNVAVNAGTGIVFIQVTSGGDAVVTGFAYAGGGAGHVGAGFKLNKTNGTGRVILRHEGATSVAGNRIWTVAGTDIILTNQDDSVYVSRDSDVTGRWRVMQSPVRDADYGDIVVSAGGTAWTVDNSAITLAKLANQDDDTFLANISGGAAPPSAVALTTLAGAGLTGGADAILAVGAGTYITVNANDVAVNRSALSADLDSTSIINNSGVLERAALTGAVSATQNSNATRFAGIRWNNGFTSAVGFLNFLDSTSNIVAMAGDVPNDETEISIQRAALTGEVTASQNSNATTIARSTNFTWTGVHSFTGTSHTVNVTGAANISADATSLITTSVGDYEFSTTDAAGTLRLESRGGSGTSGGAEIRMAGAIVLEATNIFRVSTGDPFVERFEIETDGAWQVNGSTGTAGQVLTSQGNAASPEWAASGVGVLLEVHSRFSNDVGITITPPAAATWFEFEIRGAGGGGGGADSETDGEATAGGGGGEGEYCKGYFDITSGNITGSVGAGGTAGANTGGNGGAGGNTILTYGSGITVNGGGGGAGTASGSGEAGTTDMEVTSGGQPGFAHTPTTSLFYLSGQAGGNGIMYSNGTTETNAAASGGVGGGAGGGRGGTVNNVAGTTNGEAAQGNGGGGGGGARIVSASAAATGATGGVGGDGYMIVRFYSGTAPTRSLIS